MSEVMFLESEELTKEMQKIFGEEIVSSLDLNTGSKKGVEKLFVHKSQYSEEKYG
jgi:hypothetical protein